MEENNLFDYDMLQMYYGEPYHVTDKIVIYSPTIGDIVEFGEKNFYSVIYATCSNTTMYRLFLWDNGIDWNTFSDFELFVNLITKFEQEKTKLLFGDLDFTKFDIEFEDSEEESSFKMVYSLDKDIVIDEMIYLKIVDYIRKMFDFYPKVEKAKNKATKEAIIEEERMNLKVKKEEFKPVLFPLISALLNHPGFKYKKNELKEVNIVEFMDSVKRLQIYENVRSLMTGMYSGMLDTSKMDLSKELNWARDIYNK